jgi:hypothetical protein
MDEAGLDMKQCGEMLVIGLLSDSNVKPSMPPPESNDGLK